MLIEDKDVKVVNLEEKYGPQIKFNPQYIKMLDNPDTDSETVKFLQEKIRSAKLLLENIEKRRNTIEKIVNTIVKKQKDYLDGTTDLLKPLPQKELSHVFGIHPSTISRAVSEKYIDTPRGILRLKNLCPREFKGFTSQHICSIIGEIISTEDKAHPLPDEKLKFILQEKGIDLKRRTVSDYRNQMGISISSKRKIKNG